MTDLNKIFDELEDMVNQPLGTTHEEPTQQEKDREKAELFLSTIDFGGDFVCQDLCLTAMLQMAAYGRETKKD